MATDNNKGKKPAEEAPSGKQKRLSRPKKEKEEEEEEEKTSKSSVRKSCKLLKEEKNVEGSSSGGGRSSSGKTRAMKVMLNIPAHRVDTMDSGEWVKFDQSGSPDHHRPSWCYYRCKYFSQGCPVEKHVKQSRNYQPTFDVSITKHNHPLPGHRGTSTSKSTSARKTTGKMHHNISADRVDTLDEGEWEKCAPRKEHPNRCKNFSQDCLAEKHVEPSRKNQPTFDVTYTSHRHNHRLTGSSTSKLTSLPPKSAERSAKGSSSTSRTSSPPKSTERSAKGKSSSTSRSSSPPKSTERSAKGKSSSTSKSSSPPKSTERSAKGKSSSTSKSSSPPKSAKRSAEGKSSSTSKSSSPPKSAKRSAEGKSSSTFKSSSPPKSAKRSGKGSKTSSPPKSAE